MKNYFPGECAVNRKKRMLTIFLLGMLVFLMAGSAVQADWKTTAKGTRYLLSKKKGYAKGWKQIGKKWYYFDKKGFLQKTGLTRINGKYYMLSKSTGERICGRWVKIQKKYYYFQEDGTLAVNTWIGAYRVGKDGARTGKTRSPGLVHSGKKYYYLDEQYEKVGGWVMVDGCNYYFGGSKKAAQTGLVTIDGVTYYFDENGVMQTGWQTVDELTYYFDELGIMVKNVTIQLDGVACVFDENGVCKDSGMGQKIARYALQFEGNPYVYGGSSLTYGADCSGFTYALMKNFNINIPRVADDQRKGKDGYGKYTKSTAVKPKLSVLLPGDLIFYGSKSPKYAGHVALYIGNGKVIHASTPETGIIISDYDYNPPIAARRYWS